MEDLSFVGAGYREQVCNLILETLKRHRNGLTSSDVSRITGIEPRISKMKGYVAWTFLIHLLEEKKIRREGKRYYSL